MTKVELEAKLANVQDLDSLLASIQNETDESKLLEVFKQHGLELSAADLKDVAFTEGELDADQLDSVAGGCGCGGWLQHVVWTVLNWAAGMKSTKHADGTN